MTMQQPTAKQPRPPYRVPQLAARLGVHRDTVYAWISEGVETPAGRLKLRAVKVGGILFVRRRDWRAFLRAQADDAEPPANPGKRRPPMAERAAKARAELERRRTGRKGESDRERAAKARAEIDKLLRERRS
jgi:excisionase family DNA binding protein